MVGRRLRRQMMPLQAELDARDLRQRYGLARGGRDGEVLQQGQARAFLRRAAQQDGNQFVALAVLRHRHTRERALQEVGQVLRGHAEQLRAVLVDDQADDLAGLVPVEVHVAHVWILRTASATLRAPVRARWGCLRRTRGTGSGSPPAGPFSRRSTRARSSAKSLSNSLSKSRRNTLARPLSWPAARTGRNWPAAAAGPGAGKAASRSRRSRHSSPAPCVAPARLRTSSPAPRWRRGRRLQGALGSTSSSGRVEVEGRTAAARSGSRPARREQAEGRGEHQTAVRHAPVHQGRGNAGRTAWRRDRGALVVTAGAQARAQRARQQAHQASARARGDVVPRAAPDRSCGRAAGGSRGRG